MIVSQAVVIDSNLVVLSVLKLPNSTHADRVFDQLLLRRVNLWAPRLWLYEAVSTIHKYFYDKLITPEAAFSSLSSVLRFHVQSIDEDERLSRSAFEWATRLGQKAAYDGFYLATAERLGAEFWTADERLTNRARQLGVTWVHWMEEMG